MSDALTHSLGLQNDNPPSLATGGLSDRAGAALFPMRPMSKTRLASKVEHSQGANAAPR